MWCVPAHMNAHTTASGKKNPPAVPALMPASFTLGATPTIPIPFLAAAIVPAVWVPCPLSSIHAAGLVSGTPPIQDTLSAKSTFGARSGCVKSRPVSMSPTTTSGLPPLMACACGALIWFMSHCRPDRLSPPGAGTGASTGPLLSITSLTFVANPSVRAAPATLPFCCTVAAKLGPLDRAITTPICE